MSSKQYNPLAQPVIERDYTKINVDVDATSPLDVPQFEAPSEDAFANIMEDAGNKSQPEPKKEQSYGQPNYNEMSNKEKKEGAKQLTEVILSGYGKLCNGLGSLGRFSDARLEREFAEGSIDPNIPIPIDANGTTVTISDYAKEFNESSKEAFEVSEEFKENVRPPLIRVLEKKGFGMTDEQMLIYYFGSDIAEKGYNAFQLRKNVENVMEHLRAQTDAMRNQVSARPPEPQPAQQSPQQERPVQPTPRPTQEYTEPQETAIEDVEMDEIMDNIQEVETSPNSQFVSEVEKHDKANEFGNTAIHKQMEEIEKENAKPTRKRGRKPKNKK